MGKLDAPLRKVAQTVINQFGTDVTFTSVSDIPATGGYDPATGTVSAPSTPSTSVTVKGRVDEYQARELNDTIKVGDRRLSIAAKTLEEAGIATPDVDDTVTILGVPYDIIRVESVIGTDQVVYHVIQLRR